HTSISPPPNQSWRLDHSRTVTMSEKLTGGGDRFGEFCSIGATEEAVMSISELPVIFTILLFVLVSLILEGVLIWYIHFATRKPEQMKKKAGKKGLASFIPSALRRG